MNEPNKETSDMFFYFIRQMAKLSLKAKKPGRQAQSLPGVNKGSLWSNTKKKKKRRAKTKKTVPQRKLAPSIWHVQT